MDFESMHQVKLKERRHAGSHQYILVNGTVHMKGKEQISQLFSTIENDEQERVSGFCGTEHEPKSVHTRIVKIVQCTKGPASGPLRGTAGQGG